MIKSERQGGIAMHDRRVAVFGIGGVGGYAADALIRARVGTIDIFDNDVVSVSNINRQLIATHKTIGRAKVEVMAERAAEIDPSVTVNTHNCFYMPDTADSYDLSVYDFIIDAIDTVTAKIELITRAAAAGVPMISCMGTGNKLDASQLEVTDIYNTSVCPLARVMRHELKRRGIEKLKVVYSREQPIKPKEAININGRNIPGSTAFVPAVAGLIAAGEAIKALSHSKAV